MNSDTFLGMLVDSPFSGLQEHMVLGNKATGKLEKFLTAVSQSDWNTASECREEIVNLENQADDIKNNIRNNLPKSLFTDFAKGILIICRQRAGIPPKPMFSQTLRKEI